MTILPRPRPAVLAAAFVTFAAVHARAVDTVDLQVGFRDRVTGTIRPADERESYFLATYTGVTVTVSAKRTGAGDLVPQIELLDGAGADSLATGVVSGKGSKLAGFVIDGDDGVRVRVAGDGVADGDYRIDFKLKAPGRRTFGSDGAVDPAEEFELIVGAPRGAQVHFDARGADGAVPRLLEFTHPGTGESFDLTFAEPEGARTTVALGEIASTGDWRLRVRNDGPAAGAITVRVRVISESPDRTVIDLTDGALEGDFAGAQAVVGRIADPSATTVIVGPDGLGLEGVSIEVPAGAVSIPTLISMTQGSEFTTGDDESAAGATVEFEPSGTEFSAPVTVTLPYDPETVDDPMQDIEIVTESADGSQERSSPTSVDTEAETVSFPATHFSRFQPTTRKPRPFSGRFVALSLAGFATADFGHTFVFDVQNLDSPAGPRVLRPVSRTIRGGGVSWSRGSVLPDTAQFPRDDADAGTATIVNPLRVDLAIGNDAISLDRDRDPRIYSALSSGATFVRTYLVLQRTPGGPTATNLAGRWRVNSLETTTFQRSGDPTLRVDVTGFELAMDVAPDGRAGVSGQRRATFTQDFPTGAWKTVRKPLDLGNPTLVPFGGEAILTTSGGRAIPLVPALGGDVLVGAASDEVNVTEFDTLRFAQAVILVRDGSGLSAESLTGPGGFLARMFELAPSERTGAPATLRIEGRTEMRRHAVGGGGPVLEIGGVRHRVEHDPSGAGFLAVSAIPLVADIPFRVRSDGAYDVDGPPVGGFVTFRRPALVLFEAGPGAVTIGAGFGAR